MQERRKGDGWGIARFGWLRHPPEFVAGLVYAVAAILLLYVFIASCWLLARVGGLVFHDGDADQINKLLLALAGIIGAPFVVWRVIIASKQNEIAQENVHTTLLTKAVEQLGATRDSKQWEKVEDGSDREIVRIERNLEVRLGAIYALEKLARDYPPLHWPIMEILCAYVRLNGTPLPKMSEEVEKEYRDRLSN